MGFLRQESWSGLHFLLQGIFPTQGSNSHLLCLLSQQADSFTTAPLGSPSSFLEAALVSKAAWVSSLSVVPYRDFYSVLSNYLSCYS